LGETITKQMRLAWTESFPKLEHRNDVKKVKDTSLFLVLSQDCDISCRKDSDESCVEFVVCKKIRERDLYAGNSFVRSVRKLQFEVDSQWYEANVDYILTVPKNELLDALDPNQISLLSEEYALALPKWRSNRYLRSALPDNFNKFADQAFFESHLEKIELIAKAAAEYSSYIRSIYIYLDSMDEQETYKFDFFALLHNEVDDETMSNIQAAIESMACELENISGFEDISEMYADRDSSTTISYLTRFVRLNLDYASLQKGDSETGPTDI